MLTLTGRPQLAAVIDTVRSLIADYCGSSSLNFPSRVINYVARIPKDPI